MQWATSLCLPYKVMRTLSPGWLMLPKRWNPAQKLTTQVEIESVVWVLWPLLHYLSCSVPLLVISGLYCCSPELLPVLLGINVKTIFFYMSQWSGMGLCWSTEKKHSKALHQRLYSVMEATHLTAVFYHLRWIESTYNRTLHFSCIMLQRIKIKLKPVMTSK